MACGSVRRQSAEPVERSALHAGRNGAATFLDGRVLASSDVRAIAASAVDAALQLTGADMGNLQLYDPVHRVLRIVAQRGFDDPFLRYFARVHRHEAACGRAIAAGERVIVEDVTQSPVFADNVLDVVLGAGARAVQSTPLIDGSGRLLGVLSTHYARPWRPADGELRLLDVLAHRAARWIERRSIRTPAG